MRKIKRLLLVSRPIFWVPLASIYSWGVIIGSNHWDFFTVLGLICFTFPLSIAVFGINDIADIESDHLNARKGAVDGAVVAQKEKKLIIKTLAGSILFVLAVFLISGRYLSLLMVGCIVLLVYVYSMEPIRLKSIPVADSFSNGLGLVLMFLSGYFMTIQDWQSVSLPLRQISIVFLAAVSLYALATLLDYEADQKTGDRTAGLLLGKHLTAVISLLLLSVCFLLAKSLPVKLFFGICVLLCSLICIKPELRVINKMKLIFLVMISVPLPAIYLFLS